MATAEVASDAHLNVEQPMRLRRAVIASAIGTTIEWYDFFLYLTVSGLVFPKLYFPASNHLIGTLQSYGVFFVGFLARPVGGAIFGHYGDRIGRKSALIATLLLTGLATFAVALVPGYEQIGAWGAVLLIVLRFIQGVGVGGEWGGSVLLAMEWAKTNKHRGFIASWPQLGAPCGLALANLAVLVFSKISGEHFLTWGWRIPFLLSIGMVGIGLYIRLGILETPVFARVIAEGRIERAPLWEAIKCQPKQIILSALVRMGEQAPSYIFMAYIFTYGTEVLGNSRNFVLSAMFVTAVLSTIWVPISGHLSDRVGRKRMFTTGAVINGAFAFVYFGLLETRSPVLMFTAIALSLLPAMNMYAPEAAMIAESFQPRLRYSGAGLGYQLASVIAGGPAPMIATALFHRFQSGYAIAWYMFACCIVSLIATTMLKDYTNKDIS